MRRRTARAELSIPHFRIHATWFGVPQHRELSIPHFRIQVLPRLRGGGVGALFQFLILGYRFGINEHLFGVICSLSIPHFRIPTTNHTMDARRGNTFNSSF